jgi:hypothetical protein
MTTRYNDFLVDLAMLLKKYDYIIETIDCSGAIWINSQNKNSNLEFDGDHQIYTGELSFNSISDILSKEENKNTLMLKADSIDTVKFEISGDDFINGKYNKIHWAPEHASMDSGYLTFEGGYADNALRLVLRKHGFIEVTEASNVIPANVLKGRKFLVYVTNYKGFLNIDFEELMQ